MTYDSRNKILAIIGVLYNNLSRQSALLRELKMGPRLKEKLLEGYISIEEGYTFKLFNQSIVHLQTKKLAKFSHQELERYGVKRILAKTVAGGNIEVVEKYLERIFGRKHC